MIDPATPSGITVAVGATADRANELATALGRAYGLDISSLHVERVTQAPEHTPQEALASAIASEIPEAQLLVIESENADRWRSRSSVAEHVIDAHRNMTVALGPATNGSITSGPIVVALDGSTTAEAALPAAAGLSAALDRAIVLARVVPALLHDDDVDHNAEAHTMLSNHEAALRAHATSVVVVESNDPVTALVDVCATQEACFIVMASTGDRETTRSTMSRTAAGLIAEAPCPVFIAHSGST